jgi:hypothetical protein
VSAVVVVYSSAGIIKVDTLYYVDFEVFLLVECKAIFDAKREEFDKEF